MNNKEFAQKCRKTATDYRTLYVKGCFGAPLTAAAKPRYIAAYAYNDTPPRRAKIMSAAANVFGFDCICFVKAMLWGWNGDANHQYGGAQYASNGVPDVTESGMLEYCEDVSEDFTHLMEGEYVYMPGHCGVYVGNGEVSECTPAFSDGVCITKLRDRKWTKHGKLPYVTYEVEETPTVQQPATTPGTALPELQRGSKGASVKAMQLLLIGYGCSCGPCGADGDFGTGTDAAVRAFQKAHRLGVDGICGPLTWGKLLGL